MIAPDSPRVLYVYPTTSTEEGGCNGCTAHVTANGSRPHRVHIINTRGVSIRLCDECIKELATMLRPHAAGGAR